MRHDSTCKFGAGPSFCLGLGAHVIRLWIALISYYIIVIVLYIFGTIAVGRCYIFNFHFKTVKGLLPNIVMKKRGIWSVGWETTARWYSMSKTLWFYNSVVEQLKTPTYLSSVLLEDNVYLTPLSRFAVEKGERVSSPWLWGILASPHLFSQLLAQLSSITRWCIKTASWPSLHFFCCLSSLPTLQLCISLPSAKLIIPPCALPFSNVPLILW